MLGLLVLRRWTQHNRVQGWGAQRSPCSDREAKGKPLIVVGLYRAILGKKNTQRPASPGATTKRRTSPGGCCPRERIWGPSVAPGSLNPTRAMGPTHLPQSMRPQPFPTRRDHGSGAVAAMGSEGDGEEEPWTNIGDIRRKANLEKAVCLATAGGTSVGITLRWTQTPQVPASGVA